MYYIFSRVGQGGLIVGRNSWNLLGELGTFEEVETFINKNEHDFEYRVVKGEELKWDVETEEVISKSTRIKSKKIVPL